MMVISGNALCQCKYEEQLNSIICFKMKMMLFIIFLIFIVSPDGFGEVRKFHLKS